MTYDNATLPALFARTCRKHPENDAIDGLSYSALHELVDCYVAGLQASSVAKGDAVCSFFSQKSVHAPAVALAVMRIGAIHVPLAPSSPERRLAEQCRAVGEHLTLLVYGPEEADRHQAESVGRKLDIQCRSVESIKSTIGDKTDVSSWDELAIILFTSGSSGPPKTTGYKHQLLALSLQASGTAIYYSSTTRVCNVIPYVWDCGNLDLFGPLLVGGAVCFAHDISPLGIVETIANKRCTHLLVPASLLQTIPTEELARLEVIISAGESASVAQFRDWKSTLSKLSATRLLNGYGLTETGMLNTVWECPVEVPSSMESIPLGRPFLGTNVDVDEANGELVISGPQVTEGYLGAQSPEFIAPPSKYSKVHYAIRTGDSGWKDISGLYYIGGRLDDRLSIFSLRIEPGETETVALAVPGIDFAHMFIHDLGEEQTPSLVLAYHVSGASHNGELLSQDEYIQYRETYEKELRERMAESVPGYQCPSAYLALGRIPRTISNKKDKRRIAALAQEVHDTQLLELAPFSLAL